MRVLILSPGGAEGLGGISRFTQYLGSALIGGGHCTDVAILKTRSVRSAWTSPLHVLRCAVSLVLERVRFGPAMCHINMASRGSALRKLLLGNFARGLGHHVVVQIHGGRFHLFVDSLQPVARALLRHSMARAHALVVLGETWKQELGRRFPELRDQMLVIYNGVPDGFSAHVRTGSVDERRNLLFLGKVCEEKGILDLLSALSALRARHPELKWRLTIAGDGDLVEARRWSQELGIDDLVSMVGWVGSDDVSRLIGQAEIFVLPSHDEAMPLSVLEAMSGGCAVITTAVGALPEVLSCGENAIIVQPRDREGLYTALKILLAEPDMAAQLGQRARLAFEDRFSSSVCAAAWADLYRRLYALGR